MDDGSPLDGILDVDLLLCMYNLLGEKSMIRAYTSILCALLLYVGVVSIDRYMLIEQIEPNTLSIGRVAHE
ncbi:hypothetical protein BK135_10010 [Paenibacillus peoriae]|nr:hypothetical protein BK135_10010 [Paenibacillus peoriae]